ncbi:hypothetical protein ACHAWC_006236 [Mediolabrus comicus]
MVEVVEVTRADLVASMAVKVKEEDDNPQASQSQTSQTSTKRKRPLDNEPTTAEKIDAAKERLRTNRARNSEILSQLSSQSKMLCIKSNELAKIENEIDKLEREKQRNFAALEDIKKEEEQIKNELDRLKSLSQEHANARGENGVISIRRSTPISPDGVRESKTNALDKQNQMRKKSDGDGDEPASDIDADKNQEDVEMDDSSVERSIVVVGTVGEPVRLGSKVSRMESKHIRRNAEKTGEELKRGEDKHQSNQVDVETDDSSVERSVVVVGAVGKPVMLGSKVSRMESKHIHQRMLETRATMLDAQAARAGRRLSPADIHELVVSGCGSRRCNGIYTKFGREFDGVPMYQKITRRIDGQIDNLLLYRCQVPGFGQRWSISFTPNHVDPGTQDDKHFYTAPTASNASDLPPRVGWTSFEGQEPPPQVYPKSEEDEDEYQPRRMTISRCNSSGSSRSRGKYIRQTTI